jgi:hypothetical protein
VLEDRTRTRERLDKIVKNSILRNENKSITGPELVEIIQNEASTSKLKNVRVMSPSLEDLNTKVEDS